MAIKVLGGINIKIVKDYLSNFLNDENQNVILRKYAAEILGTLKDINLIPVFCNEATCNGSPLNDSCFIAVMEILDPDPFGIKKCNSLSLENEDFKKSLEEIEDSLLCPEENIYYKYILMLKLLELNLPSSVKTLKKIFEYESDLLKRHLISSLKINNLNNYFDCLSEVLQNENEDPFVRLEAARALGFIGKDESLNILKKYRNHENQILREICETVINYIECKRKNINFYDFEEYD
ncbi:Deoxyhypusine hydroxylase [Dictyocoela muelleri]|nr:Deoxyhypusine hydroxylase [Dictyocoela muelleri]